MGPANLGQCESMLVPEKDRVALAWKDLTVFLERVLFVRTGLCTRSDSVFLHFEAFLPSETVVNAKGEERNILKGVSGLVEPGEIMCIMGPSGCGKSTLLDTLASRIHGVKAITGNILVNGRPTSLAYGRAAYVPQDDVLTGTLTVRETLMYSARLRLAPGTPKATIKTVVDDIITELGLDVCKNTKIGNWHIRGISGGQKRRVSIGVELVTTPKLIFLDEPTSGLDSASSFYVMLAVRRLAHCGRTICSTIHQPSTEIFGMMDSLLLLSAGKTVYLGPAHSAIQHFASCGFKCPTHSNPSDFMLLTVNKDFAEVEGAMGDDEMDEVDSLEEGGLPRVKNVEDNINKLAACLASNPGYKKMIESIGSAAMGPVIGAPSGAGFVRSTAILFERNFLNMSRSYGFYWLRLAMYTMICICMGTIYIHLGKGWKDVYNRFAILFFSVGFLTFMAIAAVPAFIDDMKVFLRERLNGSYGVVAYTIANTATALPFLYLISLVASICCYFLAGLRLSSAKYFFRFVCTLWLALSVTESIFMMLVAMFPNFLIAMGLGAGIMGIYMLLCGFFIAANDLPNPVWRYPLHYVSFHRYAYQGFMNNEFRGVEDFACPCSVMATGCNGPCSITGEEILALYGVPNNSFAFNMGILTLMVGGYRILFILVLKFKESRTRASAPHQAAQSKDPKVAAEA